MHVFNVPFKANCGVFSLIHVMFAVSKNMLATKLCFKKCHHFG